jgi:hypothetical protein
MGFIERMARHRNGRIAPNLWLVAVTVISWGLPVVGQDIPYRGSVTSVEQNSALSFECAGTGPTIKCDFVQTTVSQEPPSSPDKIDEMVASALKEVNTSSLCQDASEQLATLRSGGNFGVELGARERKDAFAYLEVLQSFCTGPSEATAQALFSFIEDRKARSCKIGTLAFDLSLNWNSASGRWESVSAPEGGCGVVTMVFLEKDATYPTFWNYREQTIVTNKTGAMPYVGTAPRGQRSC